MSNRAVRALDHRHPLRLWVGGDSLAGSFGPALGDKVGATGIAQTVVDFKVSSGLWSNDIRDWPARATEQMTTANPDAVVFIIGTNDWPDVNQVDANQDGVPDWEPAYRAKVDTMMKTFIGDAHRPVYWLGAPVLRDDSMNRGAQAVDKIMREEATKFAPDVVYIDTYKLFASPDGSYSGTILDENGKSIDARIGDGVHFSMDGAAYLARAVYAVIDAKWHLTKQADPKHPIGWTFASGSGYSVPGYSSTPRSRYRSSTNSGNNGNNGGAYTPATNSPPASYVVPPTVGVTAPPQTSPPATSPPVTSPPHTSPPPTSPPVTNKAPSG
jgi:hypothetical protein